MVLPGFLWLGWVSLGACQKHMHVHPSLQDAARQEPNARLCMDIRSGCENLLATCCPDLRAKGVVRSPWWGLGFCSVSWLLLFGPESGLLGDAFARISAEAGMGELWTNPC